MFKSRQCFTQVHTMIEEQVQNADKAKLWPHIIDEVVCINLSTRPDRRAKVLQNFPFQFRFFSATPHSDPKTGCTQSHLDCIRYAKQKGMKNILVIEDDIRIASELCIPSLPTAYDMLYLGGICIQMDYHLNDDWVKGGFVCMHAYVVNERFYDTLLGCIDYEHPEKILDAFLCEKVHMNYQVFMLKNFIFIQDEDWSDLEQRVKWKNFNWPEAGQMIDIP